MRMSQILAENLREWGVSHVFGIPGKPISPLVLDLDSRGISFVLCRHEAGAGFAAAGFAMLKQSLGVALVTSGPGGTNALTAAGQAKAYHQPVLFLTGQPSAADMGKALGQDSSSFATDLVKMFEPVTRFSARVERADLLPRMLRHALEKALTLPRGPVHLNIPFDILVEEGDPFLVPLPTWIPPLVSPDEALEQALNLLAAARRPVLLLGKGVHLSSAYNEVRMLAEYWNLPVITTPGGKGTFPTSHPLCLGNFGLGGTEQAKAYLQSGIDLMVVVGTQLSDMSLSGFSEAMFPRQVIQFDCDPTFMGKEIPVPTHAILGDARLNLQRLLAKGGVQAETAVGLVKEWAVTLEANESPWVAESRRTTGTPGTLSAVRAIRTLREVLTRDAILFGDDGSHTFYALRHYDIVEPGTFFFDDVFGAMGHAIGYAVGAKAACPEKTIVCLTGDGCALMHGAEIATAVNHHLSVLFVVFNNGRLDMVEKGMSYHTGRAVGAVYETPLDISRYAQAMGARAYRCTNEEDLAHAVKQSLDAKMPTVIEVMVDPLEIPPILTRLLELG